MVLIYIFLSSLVFWTCSCSGQNRDENRRLSEKMSKTLYSQLLEIGIYYWINWTALLRPLFHCNHRKEKILKFSVRPSFRKFSKRFFSVARQHSDRRSVKDKFVNWKRTKQNWTYKVMVTHSRWEERDFSFWIKK